MGEDRLLEALGDFVSVSDSKLSGGDDATMRHLLRANLGFRTLADIDRKSRFLFVADEEIEYEPKPVKKFLLEKEGAGLAMLETLRPQFEALDEWTEERFEALFTELCEATDQKLGQVAQPVRVAISGGSVSPPIYDSLVLLGRERTLRRIDRCLQECRGLLESST